VVTVEVERIVREHRVLAAGVLGAVAVGDEREAGVRGRPERELLRGAEAVAVEVVLRVGRVERVRPRLGAGVRDRGAVELLRGPVLPAVVHAVAVGVRQARVDLPLQLDAVGQAVTVGVGGRRQSGLLLAGQRGRHGRGGRRRGGGRVVGVGRGGHDGRLDRRHDRRAAVLRPGLAHPRADDPQAQLGGDEAVLALDQQVGDLGGDRHDELIRGGRVRLHEDHRLTLAVEDDAALALPRPEVGAGHGQLLTDRDLARLDGGDGRIDRLPRRSLGSRRSQKTGCHEDERKGTQESQHE
jgi:hypothetical protein